MLLYGYDAVKLYNSASHTVIGCQHKDSEISQLVTQLGLDTKANTANCTTQCLTMSSGTLITWYPLSHSPLGFPCNTEKSLCCFTLYISTHGMALVQWECLVITDSCTIKDNLEMLIFRGRHCMKHVWINNNIISQERNHGNEERGIKTRVRCKMAASCLYTTGVINAVVQMNRETQGSKQVGVPAS